MTGTCEVGQVKAIHWFLNNDARILGVLTDTTLAMNDELRLLLWLKRQV